MILFLCLYTFILLLILSCIRVGAEAEKEDIENISKNIRLSKYSL